MNGCQRMLAALRREVPDRVPIWELIVNRPVIEALYPHLFQGAARARYERGSQGAFQLQADFVEAEDLDGITVFEDCVEVKWLDGRNFVDEWGITWRLGDHDIPYAVGHPISEERDLDRWRPPEPDVEGRLDSLTQAVRRFKGEKAVVFLGHDAFEFSHYLRGMEGLLVDYALNPEFVERLAGKVMQYKLRVLEMAADAGADVLCTGDDYANRHAPIMSPQHFQRFVKPYLKQCVDVAKRRGLPFLKHTDGNLWPILDSILDTGIDCLDPLEPIAGMDAARVKEACGERVCLAGNIDCGRLLPSAEPADVVEAVKETIAKAAPGGGFILASSNSIHPGVKPENYRAMVEAGREFGQYPLDETMVGQYKNRDYMARYR